MQMENFQAMVTIEGGRTIMSMKCFYGSTSKITTNVISENGVSG